MKVRKLFIVFTTILLMGACAPSASQYDAALSFDKKAEETFLLQLMPLIAQRAPQATDSTRFEKEFEEYYKGQLSKFDLISYLKNEDSSGYFLIYKNAPSLKVKKIAIGGRVKLVNDSIVEFEEFFNTPKMVVEELDQKASALFSELIKKGNVQAYVGQAGYIEFPDSSICYDKKKLKWRFISDVDKAQ